MNFASDNIMGASAPVMQALMRANAGAMPAYGTTRSPRASKHGSRRSSTMRSRSFSSPPAPPPTRSPGRRPCRLGDCASATKRRTSSTTSAAHPNSSCTGQSSRDFRGSAGNSLPPPCGLSRQPAEGVKQMPPKALSISQAMSAAWSTRPPRSPRSPRSAEARPRPPYGRRAFRQRPAALGARRPNDLEAGVRHPLIRRDQERLPHRGSDRRVRQEPRRGLDYRPKRAGHLISKGRFIAAQLEGYFGRDHWLATRVMPMTWRSVSPRAWRSCPA